MRYSLDQTLPCLALAIETKVADNFTVDVNPLNGSHQAVRRVLIRVDSDIVGTREISLPIRVIKIDHVEAVRGLDRILLVVHPVRVWMLPRNEDVCITVKGVELE